MSKTRKIIAFVLTAAMVLSLGTFGSFAAGAKTAVATMPTVFPSGALMEVKSALHFEDDAPYIVNSVDSTYDTLALEYGYTEVGAAAGNALTLMTGGSGKSAQALLTFSPDNYLDMDGCEGIMFYSDLSGLKTSTNGKVGMSVTLYPIDKDGNPSFDSFMSASGNGFTADNYGVDGYYYDAETDKWIETGNDFGGSCMAVPEGFKGWIYVPFKSYYHFSITMSGYSFSGGYTSGRKDDLVSKAIDKGMTTVWAMTVNSGGYLPTEAGTSVLIDEISFVGKGKDTKAHQHKYGAAVETEGVCGAVTVTETCSSCGFAHTYEKTAPAHKFSDWMYDAENLIKVRVCSECGEVENEIAGPADVSLPAYDDADHGTVTVVFDFNNGGPRTAIHVPKGSAIDMDDVLYPFDFLFGAAHYIFNCWTTDPEGVYPSNPDGAIVKEDTTYYIRWSLETTSTYYDPAYKIETTEGGPYNAGKLNAGKVIFYGSSNFRMWSTLITDMAPEIPALNHGISGCNDTHLLAYLNRLVLSYRPKITVINCSTNDLLTLTNEQIKLNKEELVRIIHETDPEMVILFTSHMPLPAYKGTENQDRMEELNVWVEDFCSTHDNVEYIDVFSPVIDLPGEYFNDSLHFSALGQELYGKLLKDKLLEMVDEYGISFDDAGMPPEAADDTDEPEDTETPPEDVETPPEDETDPVVMRSNQTITVDGEAVEFDVYNIDGNNYFKLRDIAMTLDGTDSTFAVGYDSATRTITCTSGEAYEANGSELVIGEDLSATAVRSNQPLYVDGELSTIKAYNLGGNNFFQLRELGAALGFGVDYDSATRTVIIDSAA